MQQELITQTLKKVFPQETMLIGDEILEMIGEGDSAFEYHEGGSHLDFTQIIEILKLGTDILIVILGAIEIGKRLSPKKEQKILELVVRFINNDSEFDKIKKSDKEKLINEIFEKQDSISNE